MLPRRSRLLSALALTLLFATACDSAPTLSNFKPVSSMVKRGDAIVLNAMLEYFGGDINGGKQVVTLTLDGLAPVVKELPIELGGSASRAAITLSIETNLLYPKGPVKVQLQVIDKSGIKSNLVETTVTLT
ncbi:MAG: hypothetical protein EXR72_13205 [Myxococcales bacterium]|nr:hypothetical protein [Myxococcales bacterium]